MSKLYQDEEWLKKKYLEEKLSLSEMAELARCSKGTIRNHMICHGIPRRSGVEVAEIACDPTTSAGRARRRKRSEASRKAYDPATSAGRALRRKQSIANKAARDPTTPKGKALRRKTSENLRAAYDPTTPRGRALRQKQSENLRAAYDPTTPRGKALRRKTSENLRAAWANGVYDRALPPSTSIEIAVSVAFDILDIEHKPQYRPDGYSRVYDEFVPPNVLIEVQGDYWHSLDETQKRDAEKAAWACDNGYHLVVIWEHEIHEVGAIELVKERVLAILEPVSEPVSLQWEVK